MSSSLLYPSPHMGQAQLEAYMWQKVPGAPDRKFNPFRPKGAVPAERYGEHGLLGVGQKGISSTMAAIPRPSGPAGSMGDPPSNAYVRAGAAPSGHTSINGSLNPSHPSAAAHSPTQMRIDSGALYPPSDQRSIDPQGLHPSDAANRGSPVSSIPHNPPPATSKPRKHKSKHAPPVPTKKSDNSYPDIPMPSSSGTENPFLQAYDELAKEDKYHDFEAPAMMDGPICWNPRESEMHNMQDWHTERQAYIRKLEDPRRRYLARYAHIRETLCSNRFRNPEYSRIVPGTCTPTENPWNYTPGSPPSMFGSAPLGDQSMSDGVAVQRSIGNLPVHKWETDGGINIYDAYESTGTGRNTNYTIAPASAYASQAFASCPPGTVWDQVSGTCQQFNGSTAALTTPY